MRNYEEDLLNALFGKAPEQTILVYWGLSEEAAEYSNVMLNVIKQDEACRMILDGQTGEIIYNK